MTKYITLLIVLCLIGCGERLSHGKIIGREHIPCHTSLILHQVGKISVPQVIVYPDSYQLKVEGKLKNGEIVKQSFSISKQEYETLKDGQEYYSK